MSRDRTKENRENWAILAAAEHGPTNPARWRFNATLERVFGLLELYEFVAKMERKRRPMKRPEDILRAATVFLHAAVEEFLRAVAEDHWPSAGSDVLKSIPLLDDDPATRRNTKHTLGDLAKHRGKTVDAVLRESIRAHLKRETFNNVTDVVNLLRTLGIEIDPSLEMLSDLGELMDRRHRIVHEADVAPRRRGQLEPTVRRIGSLKGFNTFLSAADDLVRGVSDELAARGTKARAPKSQ